MAQRIYDGEKITFDRDLLHETAKTYMDAVQKGYGKSLPDVAWNSPDFKTLEKLTENVFKFSASKNYNTLRDMSLLLKDGDHIRTFDDFQKEVDKLNVKYNHNWLRTEYNQAVASSQCAARWTDYGRRADKNPFLQYQAVMDANTRAEHAALNGIIKRYDDEFWDKYYPPNGWGCRCEVIQLPGKNHKETPAADIKYCNVPAAFKVNVGKTGKIFSEEHPYFMQRCRSCRTQLGNPDPNNPQCQACQYGMAQCRTFVEDCKVKADKERTIKKTDEYNFLHDKTALEDIEKREAKITLQVANNPLGNNGETITIQSKSKRLQHAIKSMFNDPDYLLKNQELKHFESWFADANCVDVQECDNTHNGATTTRFKDDVDYFFYFETKLSNGSTIYLHVAHFIPEKGGRFELYHISRTIIKASQ